LSDGGWVFSVLAARDCKRLDRPVRRRIVNALERQRRKLLELLAQ
jgi:hypothetical protein